MRYTLYRWIMIITLVIAGILQLFEDIFISGSILINVTKVILLAIAVIYGFKYFENKSGDTKITGETEIK